MTLQHSPGPFKFHRPGWYIEDSEGNAIAEVNSAYPGDGHIFAAAPDMLRLLRVLARIPLEQARLGIGPRAAIKEARKMLQELDGDTCHGN